MGRIIKVTILDSGILQIVPQNAFSGENNAVQLDCYCSDTLKDYTKYIDFESNGVKYRSPAFTANDPNFTFNIPNIISNYNTLFQFVFIQGDTVIKTQKGTIYVQESVNAADQITFESGDILDDFETRISNMESDVANFIDVYVQPSIEINQVTTLAPGASVSVQNIGTPQNAILNIGIPKGDNGSAGTIAINQVTTLAPGSLASVQNVGTPLNAVLNIGIPKGDTGAPGTIVDNSSLWYGVRIDKDVSSSALTRRGNLEFHKTLPIQSRMRRAVVNDSGNVVYWLYSTNSALQDNGAPAKLDGTDGQVMTWIPNFYYKFSDDGRYQDIMFSDIALPEFQYFAGGWMGAFEASLNRINLKLASVVNNSTDYRGGNNNSAWDGTYRSLLGEPVTNLSLTQFRTYARNRGANWNCQMYSLYKMLYWLYVCEYANLNSQLPFNGNPTVEGYKQGGLGDGITTLTDPKWSAFNSYHPVVNCGTTVGLGNKTGYVVYNMPVEYNAVIKSVNIPSYRGIENPFGHILKWTDGLLCKIEAANMNSMDSKFYVCDNPVNYADTVTTNYIFIGLLPRNSEYIKKILFGENGNILPLEVGSGASSVLYFSDIFYTSLPANGSAVSTRGVLFGGVADYGAGAGFASAYTYYTPSIAGGNIGSRLCYIGA